jgi:hypothetical protein
MTGIIGLITKSVRQELLVKVIANEQKAEIILGQHRVEALKKFLEVIN